jgi:hypothetical protein
MVFTPELFKYFLTQMIPEIIVHSESQDEEQVRGHYDRTYHRPIFRLLYSPVCPQVETTFTNGTYYSQCQSIMQISLLQVLGSPHGLHLRHYDLAYRASDT